MKPRSQRSVSIVMSTTLRGRRSRGARRTISASAVGGAASSCAGTVAGGDDGRSRILAALIASASLAVAKEDKPIEREYTIAPAAPSFQTWEDANAKSNGCVTCHTDSESKTMHVASSVVLGCVDCHGGNASVAGPAGEFHPRHGIGQTDPLLATEFSGGHHGGSKRAKTPVDEDGLATPSF